ncbi:MAG: DedA family protein [Planctomycetota bacterium]|nr:DedA family protein [Planctomycetota bacterium]
MACAACAAYSVTRAWARARRTRSASRLTEQLVQQLGYVGIALLLILGGLGLPVPEEAPIVLAAVLSRSGRMWWPFAFGSCFAGVLAGDFVVYFLGFHYGERVLKLRLTRAFLTREREEQIKGYFHRHGFKILILGRFAVGFRTAAYLTAGILKLPPLKLFFTDLLAATLSTTLMFALGYVFAHQIEASFDRLKHWLLAVVAAGLSIWLLYRYVQARRRRGRPVGPPLMFNGVEGFEQLDAAAVEPTDGRVDGAAGSSVGVAGDLSKNQG